MIRRKVVTSNEYRFSFSTHSWFIFVRNSRLKIMNTQLLRIILFVSILYRIGFCEDINVHQDPCYWSGTAPFCFPNCPNNWATCTVCNDCCELQTCLTGSHFYCCPTRSQCPSWPCASSPNYSVLLVKNNYD